MTDSSSWTRVPFRVRQAIRADIAAHLPLACVICGRTVHAGTPFHVEHIVSIDAGGPMLDPANMGPAHPRCNLSKGARDLDTPSYVAPWAHLP